MLHLFFVGRSEDPFREVERYYSERVKSSAAVNISELSEDKRSNTFEKRMKGKTYITSPGGREITEEEFFDIVKESRISEISVAVGGPSGIAESVAGERISFSRLTFSHGLFRVMLLEQVYRQLLTLKGSDYRK
jgi:23S rRNA (pseudouridine1915-N3)-methyltransferase